MTEAYPPRIQAFRNDLIKVLPRAPNDRRSRESLRTMPTNRLILAFITWRMRLIPAKRRTVTFWSGGVTPIEARMAGAPLRTLLEKVTAGRDLTPYLSDRVNRVGIDLSEGLTRNTRRDIDMVLTREGLHHFHVGERGVANPKGRSGSLVFAEVLEREFRVVALSDHRAFTPGNPEHQRFFELCQAYMAKDIPPGQAFMANPVMSSGHSMHVTLFARWCDEEMQRMDPSLDDPGFIEELYRGQPISKPAQPTLAWHFLDLQFGILDRQSKVFFCRFPYFTR